MTTKAEYIAQLKLENPTLKVGSDEAGYTQLTPAEYEAQIAEWAENKVLADMPKPEPTVAEKLESVGLSIPELKAALGL